MPYIQESLSDGEQIVHLFKLHWLTWLPVWLLYLTILLIPIAIYRHLDLWTREFGVTNRRAIFKRGIISRRTQEMKLASIETVEIDQGVIQRIFGTGTVRITGRGISDVVMAGIDDPMDVKRKIESVRLG